MRYKRPAFWLVMILVLAGFALGLRLLAGTKGQMPAGVPPAQEQAPALAASPRAEQAAAPSPAVAVPLPEDVPEGFIVNAAGATDAEVAAVFHIETAYYPNYAKTPVGVRLYFYARQDWRGGALVLAGIAEQGELMPELYFIKDGKALMRTSGSYAWTLHYTHYQGETIVFGKSFAWDNRPLPTDAVRAEFENGATVSVPMEYRPDDKEVTVSRGFICATPSITWLTSLEILYNGEVVADDTSPQFVFDPPNEPWYGEPESIRNRTHYTWADDISGQDYGALLARIRDGFHYTPQAQDHEAVRDFFGRAMPSLKITRPYKHDPAVFAAPMHWPQYSAQEGPSPNIWKNSNWRYHLTDAKAGSEIVAELSSGGPVTNTPWTAELALSKIYWVDLSIKDDAACISEGELVCPKKKGFYVLILLTDYGYFSQMLRVM